MELKGQEIFAIGEWNSIEFTEADVDSIVSSFEALGLAGHVPLKLGHEGPDARDDPAMQFALGWVQRVYREGKKLLADFDVPEKVANWIKEGFLRFVSVELLKDVKASTREIPWVLDAVALLGADQPAVGILKSLSLTMARSTALQCRERVAFSRETPTGGHKPTMADEPNKDIAAILTRLSALEEENKTLKVSAAESETNKRLFTELKEKTQGEKVTAHRAAVLALFETAVKEKKILPAVRERFKRAYPVDKDDVLNIPLTDVETFIRENPNPDAPRNPQSLAAGGDHVSVDALADDQALAAARKFVRENAADPEFKSAPRWEQLVKAGMAVFRANPDLGKSYQRLPETLASGE